MCEDELLVDHMANVNRGDVAQIDVSRDAERGPRFPAIHHGTLPDIQRVNARNVLGRTRDKHRMVWIPSH